jgi:glycosyltransferase, family 1
MHILKIIHGYPPNYNAGSEVYSESVCNELSKQHRVSVFTREENLYARDFTIRKESRRPNLDIYIVNNPQGKDGYRHEQMDSAFESLLSELKPDIAYIGHLNHLSTGLVEVLYQHRIPIVYMLHDFWLMCPRGQFLTRSIGRDCNFTVCNRQEDARCAQLCYGVYFSGYPEDSEHDNERWTAWVKRRMNHIRDLVSKVDLFIAPAKFLMNRYIQDFKIPQDKILYLDYGFPTDYLDKALLSPTAREVFTFGYIGTHIPAKGVNLLLEAFATLPEPVALRIYGRPNGQSTQALKKIASQLPKHLKVEFCGEYSNDQLIPLVFNQVDGIVVPSIWAENSPLVIHEAQACCIPVITADYGGMAEYVAHHENGLLFRHRDSVSLAEQMLWAMQHPEEFKRLGHRGYLYNEDGLVPNIEQHCVSLIDVFENVCS